MKEKYKFLIEYAKSLSLDISDEQLNQFDTFYNMLIEWNEKVNLTAITEFEQVVVKHFADSIAIAAAVDIKKFDTVIDVGTGGGFPGIPLKIMFPHLKITLLDSLNKRLVFLNEVIETLGLSDISTIHGRAEDIARDKNFREKYDLCVSRAVANLSTLTEICVPFVKLNGYFISYKSEKAAEEIEAAKKSFKLLGAKFEKCENVELKDNTRCFVFIKKTEGTSKIYPRKAGTPAKKPL